MKFADTEAKAIVISACSERGINMGKVQRKYIEVMIRRLDLKSVDAIKTDARYVSSLVDRVEAKFHSAPLGTGGDNVETSIERAKKQRELALKHPYGGGKASPR